MSRPIVPPTTEEHRPPTAQHTDQGRPVLLVAFPSPKVIPIPKSNTIVGRSWFAEFDIVDSKISTQHARLTVEGGQWKIEDLGSRNFTFRDGHRLDAHKKVPLEDGTVLRMGGTLMVFRERFSGSNAPEIPLGTLVGPFGLSEAREKIAALKKRPTHPVLIEGETGTGKEELSRQVIAALNRLQKCTAVNVAGVPETLFEAHLFGSERGAFTGSVEARRGVFREHDGGAVFLDELGELPLTLQPKLLRLLDGHGVMAVGASKEVPVNVAIVAATNRNLAECVEKGTFRRDLWARFAFRIALPKLDDRREDIFAVARALWERRYGALDLSKTRVDVEAVELMLLHDWPANVRDVDRLIAGMDPAAGLKLSAVEQGLKIRSVATAPPPTIDVIERAIEAAGGNKSEAARRLGISNGYLHRRLKEKKGA